MRHNRFRQADREALIVLGMYGFFFLWWTLFAFGLGGGDPEQYSYVFGMPAWFFYSCVLGYPVVTLLLWGVIRFAFSDMPLNTPDAEATRPQPDDAPSSPATAGKEGT